MKYTLSAMTLLMIAGCTGGGPRTDAILNGPEVQKIASEAVEPYVLIDLDQAMATRASRASAKASTRFFSKGGAQPVVIGAGDELEISIVVTSENGFVDFTANQVSPVSTTRLPAQEVGSDGNVSVPPIGRVNARGQTVQQFEAFLTRKLGEQLVDPSVIVRLSNRRSAQLSVVGSVQVPGTYSINQNAQHLIDVIGLAGGPRRLGNETRSADMAVSVSRAGTTRTVPLSMVYQNPNYNIHMRKGDVVALEPLQTRIQMLGGTSRNAVLDFDKSKVTLVDVLSTAGGLLNRRADRRGIFVFRRQSQAATRALGADTKAFGKGSVPTVYRLDLSEPTAFFTAGLFDMRDGDVVYVADSLNEEIRAIFGASSLLAPTPAEYVRDATITN